MEKISEENDLQKETALDNISSDYVPPYYEERQAQNEDEEPYILVHHRKTGKKYKVLWDNVEGPWGWRKYQLQILAFLGREKCKLPGDGEPWLTMASTIADNPNWIVEVVVWPYYPPDTIF